MNDDILNKCKDLLLKNFHHKVLNNKVVSFLNDNIGDGIEVFIAYNNVENKYLKLTYVPGSLYLMQIFVYNKITKENIGCITVKVTKDKRIISIE